MKIKFLFYLVCLIGIKSLWASPQKSIEERLAYLESQDKLHKSTNLKGLTDLEFSFPGQYRINSYSVNNDKDQQDQQTASRLRIRQSIDIKFNENLKSSLRFQLNHTNENTTNAQDVNGNDVQIRHAVINYKLTPNNRFKAGLVPVLEYYHDTLYSKSWGYNPLALEGFSKVSNFDFHYFISQLQENKETNSSDDTNHFQFDMTYHPSDKVSVTASSSYLNILDLGSHYNVALKTDAKISDNSSLMAIIMGSQSDKDLLNSAKNAQGYAVLLELLQSYSNFEVGLMFTHTSGKKDGSGFLVPMSFTKTNSYWGYTGVMTVMPQTDTGFASDSVHISNNGFGMSSYQTKISYYPNDKTLLYFGAGFFNNSQAENRDSTVGYDVVAMYAYNFNTYLRVDVGIDYAQLHDSLSGYTQGVIGGTRFNQDQGVTRYKTAFFSRLQLEF